MIVDENQKLGRKASLVLTKHWPLTIIDRVVDERQSVLLIISQQWINELFMSKAAALMITDQWLTKSPICCSRSMVSLYLLIKVFDGIGTCRKHQETNLVNFQHPFLLLTTPLVLIPSMYLILGLLRIYIFDKIIKPSKHHRSSHCNNFSCSQGMFFSQRPEGESFTIQLPHPAIEPTVGGYAPRTTSGHPWPHIPHPSELDLFLPSRGAR